jgi:histidinol dehydrogenase
MRMLLARIKKLSEEDKKTILTRGINPEKVYPLVREIINAVKTRGDNALLQLTQKYDGVALKNLRVTADEFDEAEQNSSLKRALKRAYKNINSFHKEQLRKEWRFDNKGASLGQVYRAIKRVGCYIPGGRAAYPSTVLMTVIPAQVAGVREIFCITPPNSDGKANSSVLMACDILGIRDVYKVGGAQGIAALAYGTESIPPVEKIVGPGNIYVTAAKLLVSDRVAIDFPAGPSEVLIIADSTANPEFIALDMLAQGEHDPLARSVLVTTSQEVATLVVEKIGERTLEEGNMTILISDSLEEAVKFANLYAPEHLEIHTSNPEALVGMIENAGSIFLGSYTPVALGDYVSGTNHVLPTQGWARVYSGLGVRDFLKEISVQRFDRSALRRIAQTVITLAEKEGLPYHAESLRRRLELE